MLELIDVNFRRGGRQVLESVSLTVLAGQMVVVTGANGSGKSALASSAIGLLPAQGRTLLDGKPLTKAKVRRKVGFLPQTGGLYDYLSAAETLRFYAGVAGVPGREWKKVVTDLLELVGLSDWASTEVSRLTEGQKRRLLLARALVGDPMALVLDEPLAGLDAQGRLEVSTLLADLCRMGKAILVVAGDAHGLKFSHLYSLVGGRLLLEAAPAAETAAAGPILAAPAADPAPPTPHVETEEVASE